MRPPARSTAVRAAAPGLVAALVVVASLLAGCGAAPTSTPARTPAATAAGPSPVTSPPPGSASTMPPAVTASVAPSTATSPGAVEPTPAAGTVVEDASLLAVLPAEVGGARLVVEPQAFAEAASDPDFAANAEAAAFFVVTSADDLASGVVARLRPGVYSEDLFRDWRDTYDRGACAQAGGVAGNAQAEVGGRTVHITSCAGGLLVYHAHLEGRDTLVSLISVGEARFGEQVMAGVRP